MKPRVWIILALAILGAAGLIVVMVLGYYGLGELRVRTPTQTIAISDTQPLTLAWQPIAQGVRLAQTPLSRTFAIGNVGTLVLVCFQQRAARFRVLYSPKHKTCEEFANQEGLWFCINGSFFATAPLGLVVSGGERITAPHRFMRGFFAVYPDGTCSVSISNEPPPENVVEAVQSFPALLHNRTPISDMANFYDAEARAERSVVASTPTGEVCFGVVKGGGVSFSELALLFAKMGFKDAFCLDGGSSTQMFLRTDQVSLNLVGDAVPVVIGASSQ